MSEICKRLGASLCWSWVMGHGSLGTNNAKKYIASQGNPKGECQKNRSLDLRRRTLYKYWEKKSINRSLVWHSASSLAEGMFDVSEFLSFVLFDDTSAISVKEGD